MKEITIPISDDVIRDLKVGESVALTGTMLTGRDAVHKWMIDTFIKKNRSPPGDDLKVYEAIKRESKAAGDPGGEVDRLADLHVGNAQGLHCVLDRGWPGELSHHLTPAMSEVGQISVQDDPVGDHDASSRPSSRPG